MKGREYWQKLIVSYQIGQISDENRAELEEALRTSREVRSLFHRSCRIDSGLRREAEKCDVDSTIISQDQNAKVVPFSSRDAFQRRPFFRGGAVAVAVVLLSAVAWAITTQYRIVGTLVSSENAVWETSVATETGSELTRGVLRLTSGIATVRFVSGAELTLEAPARIFVKSPRKVKLVSGTAVVKIVEGEAFTLETEYGQAVVEVGEFFASAGPDGRRCDFETISGTVQVSHDFTREAIRLTEGGSAALHAGKLESSEELENQEQFEKIEGGLRIRTDGKVATFIRNNRPYKWTRPEFLTLKKANFPNGFDQRSVVGFDLSKVNSEKLEDASLQVNLVPSGIGLASRLPKVNRFAVYGLVNPEKESWSQSDQWEDAPDIADGALVGSFEIPRTQQTGVIQIGGEEFVRFLKSRAGSTVTFIFVRETANDEGAGHGLVHAIASDVHPDAAGPILELVLEDYY